MRGEHGRRPGRTPPRKDGHPAAPDVTGAIVCVRHARRLGAVRSRGPRRKRMRLPVSRISVTVRRSPGPAVSLVWQRRRPVAPAGSRERPLPRDRPASGRAAAPPPLASRCVASSCRARRVGRRRLPGPGRRPHPCAGGAPGGPPDPDDHGHVAPCPGLLSRTARTGLSYILCSPIHRRTRGRHA